MQGSVRAHRHNPELGWSDPTSLPPNPRRSLQPNRCSSLQGVSLNHTRMYQVEYDGLHSGPTGKRTREMPVLKAPPKLIRNATIQVRVEEDVDFRLRKYAEFIGCTPAFVVAESLRMLFNKIAQFRQCPPHHPAQLTPP